MDKVEVVGTLGMETSRKLSVADTLVQATRALRKHREWMKRRISSIAPEDSEEDTGQERRSDWAISKPVLEVSASGEEGSASGTWHFSAPPPFQARGVPAPHWQHKGNLAKVAPLPTLAEESVGSRLNGTQEVLPRKTLPPQAWGSSSNVNQQVEQGGNCTVSDDVSGFTDVEPHASSASAGRKHTKRRLSKSRVSPADVSGSTGKTLTGRTQQVDSAKSLYRSVIPSTSAPSAVNVNAWGSLTTLDASLDGPATTPASQPNLSDEITIVEWEDPDFNTDSSTQPRANECQETPPSLPEQPGTQSTPAVEGERHTSDVDPENAYATGPEHVKGLQSPSSVKVVSVSPAPEAQRVAFAAHTRPKVDSAELEVQKTAVVSEVRTPTLVSDVNTSAPAGGRHHGTAHEVPQAILQPVLPFTRNRRAGVSSMIVTSAAYCPEGRPDIQARTEQSSSPTVHMNTSEDVAYLGGNGRPVPAVASVGDAQHGSGRTTDLAVLTQTQEWTLESQHASSSLNVSAETTLPTGSQHTSTLPTRSQHTSTLPTGSQHTSTLPTGSQHTSTLPTGSQHTSTLPTGSQHTSKLPTSSQHTSTLPTSSQHTSTLPTGSQHTSTLPTGSQHISTLPTGSQHISSPLAMRTEVGETTSGSRDEVLRELNLPPLREHQELYIDGGEIVKQLPPLRLQSPLSPSLTDMILSHKRERAPPTYSIHRRPGGLALAPACPEYGAEQPLERDVLNALSRRASLPSETIDYDTPANARNASEPISVNSDQSSVIVDQRISNDQSSQLDRPTSPPSEQLTVHILRHRNSLPISEMPPGPGPLHLAAKCGNLRRLQVLIAQGHNVDMPDHEGRTPLMYCIHSQGVHLSCADALIKEGANLNKLSSDGSSAMHLAASVGAVSLLELMLLNGAAADLHDFEGRLPLHWATTPRSPKGINLVIKYSSVDLNTPDDAGMTPLMWAAYNDNPTLISYLLDQGADCEEKDSDGYTAMHWAVHREGTQSLQLLLKPDMTYFKDHRGCTVLHHAAEKGSMAACELILRMRADAVYDTDKMGRTPLHYAAACSRVDVCALLLDRGADASQRDLPGKTPLDYARDKKMDYVVALLTCHGTAVADFARASRSTSVSSFLSHAANYSLLPLHTDVISETLGVSADSGEGGPGDRCEGVGGEVDVVKGGYLGRFTTTDKNDPVQHFYFWLCSETGTLSWSRETSQSGAKEGRVLEVHKGPSPTVQHSAMYSPADLHRYVFWVMTDRGVLDLFAYNEDAYITWVEEIEKLAQRCPMAVKEKLRRSRPPSAYSEISSATFDDNASEGVRPEGSRGWMESSQCGVASSHGEVSFQRALKDSKKTSTPVHSSSARQPVEAGVESPVNFEPHTTPTSLPFLDDLI